MGEAKTTDLTAELHEGEIVECTVEQIMPYGAFVRITKTGKKGMIHISELSYSFVKNITDVLNINDKIQAKIIKIDERGRTDLSLKQTKPPVPKREPRSPRPQRDFSQNQHETRDFHELRESMKIPPVGSDESFEQKMSAFLKTSEAKITDLNTRNSSRSSRSSRGSKGGRRSNGY